MDDHQRTIARACLDAAEDNRMTIPQIVGKLMETGFESYAVDFRRATATYYLPDGGSLELSTHRVDAPVAPAFDTALLQAAIRQAQRQFPAIPTKASARRPCRLVAPPTSSRSQGAGCFMSAEPPKPTSSASRTRRRQSAVARVLR